MTKMRILPHQVANDAVWMASAWHVVLDGEVLTQPSLLENWDYQSILEVSYEASVDRSALEAQTGLGANDVVAAYAVIDCPTSNVRLASHTTLAGDSAEVTIAVDPGSLAGSMRLHRGLVLLEAYGPPRPWVARAPGARLLEDEALDVVLEAEGSRFPVQAVTTDEGEELFAWTLSIDPQAEPDDPFMAVAQVLVNASHPAGQSILRPGDGMAQDIALSALQTDVVRQMLEYAQSDERFHEEAVYPDDSLGYVLDFTAKAHLGDDLPTALRRMRDNPEAHEKLLQAGTGYLIELEPAGVEPGQD